MVLFVRNYLVFFPKCACQSVIPLVLSLRTLSIGRLGTLRSGKGDANEIVAENRVRVLSDCFANLFQVLLQGAQV